MKTIAQLEKEIADAKLEQSRLAATERADKIASLKDKVRIQFYTGRKETKLPGFCMRRYTGKTLYKNSGPAYREVSVSAFNQPRDGGAGVYRSTSRESAEHHIEWAAFHYGWQDSTVEAFEALWHLAGACGFRLLELHNLNALKLTPPEIDCTCLTPDFPHVMLTPPETTFFEKEFTLNDYCYLVTPQSIAAVERRLREDDATEARCSHLYEACDFNYLTHKSETKAKVRARIAEARRLLQ